MEEFRVISEFPMYAVSNYGRVINTRRDTEMRLSHNAYDELTVGLWRDGKQHRRAVRGIVARTFVPGETKIFNTPIFLDGDRDNLNANNLAWRPRWFAIAYIKQFDYEESWWYAGPVRDIRSGDIHPSIIDAAIANGSLVDDIRDSLMNHSRVFPGGAVYEFIKVHTSS